MADDLTPMVQNLFAALSEMGLWPAKFVSTSAYRSQAEVVIADFLWDHAHPRDIWTIAREVCALITAAASSEAGPAATAARLRIEIAYVIEKGLAIEREALLAS